MVSRATPSSSASPAGRSRPARSAAAAASASGVALPRRARAPRAAPVSCSTRASTPSGARLARPARRGRCSSAVPTSTPALYGAHAAPRRCTAPTTSSTTVRDRSSTPRRARRRRADARDLPRHPGAQRRARRHVAPHLPDSPASARTADPGQPGGERRSHGRRSTPASLLAQTMGTDTSRARATITSRSIASATACASSAAPPTAWSKAVEVDGAWSCSRCSGTPRTPRRTTPRSSACSTRSSTPRRARGDPMMRDAARGGFVPSRSRSLMVGIAAACSSDPPSAPKGAHAPRSQATRRSSRVRGTTAVVMIHGATTHKDSWYPLMPQASPNAGYWAIAYDYDSSKSADVAEIVAYARAHGAKRIVLVGSSLGAEHALETADPLHVDAVVNFSSEVEHTVKEPLLAIASHGDGNTAVYAQHNVSGRGPESKVVIVNGSTHGIDLVHPHPEAMTDRHRLALQGRRGLTDTGSMQSPPPPAGTRTRGRPGVVALVGRTRWTVSDAAYDPRARGTSAKRRASRASGSVRCSCSRAWWGSSSTASSRRSCHRSTARSLTTTPDGVAHVSDRFVRAELALFPSSIVGDRAASRWRSGGCCASASSRAAWVGPKLATAPSARGAW